MSALLMTPAVWRTREQRRGVTLADVLDPLAPYKEEDWLPAGLRADYLQPKAHVIAAAQKALQAPRVAANETLLRPVSVLITPEPPERLPVASKMTTTKKRRPRKTTSVDDSDDKATTPKKTRQKTKVSQPCDLTGA